MLVIKAPNDIDDRTIRPSTLFLAGSIAMGTVEDWQAETENKFSDYSDDELVIFNPRREDFDANIKQSIDEPVLNEQVNWELDALEEADYVLMYFHPETKAPITMLELGLHADNIVKLIVCCPDGFYRQGNIEIVCKRYNIPFFKDLNGAIAKVRGFLDSDHILKRQDDC